MANERIQKAVHFLLEELFISDSGVFGHKLELTDENGNKLGSLDQLSVQSLFEKVLTGIVLDDPEAYYVMTEAEAKALSDTSEQNRNLPKIEAKFLPERPS